MGSCWGKDKIKKRDGTVIFDIQAPVFQGPDTDRRLIFSTQRQDVETVHFLIMLELNRGFIYDKDVFTGEYRVATSISGFIRTIQHVEGISGNEELDDSSLAMKGSSPYHK